MSVRLLGITPQYARATAIGSSQGYAARCGTRLLAVFPYHPTMTGPAVRPLPPEPPEPPGPASAATPSRRWLPFAVIGAALLAFAAGASLLSGTVDPASPEVVAAPDATTTTQAVGFNGEPAASTTTLPPTTTTTRPPRLDVLVPDVADEIEIVFVDSDFITWITTWNRAAAEPSVPVVVGTSNVITRFDRAGRAMAVVDGFYSSTLSVGDEHFVSSLFADATSIAWHGERGGELAWIGQPPGETGRALYTATLPDSVSTLGNVAPVDVDVVTRIADVPESAWLAAWGDWGFALQVQAAPAYAYIDYPDPSDPDGPQIGTEMAALWILDPQGNPTGSMPGVLHDAAADGSLIVKSLYAPYRHLIDEGADIADLGLVEPVVTAAIERSDLSASGLVVVGPRLRYRNVVLPPGQDSFQMFTPDGETIVALTYEGDRLSLTSQLRDGSRRRLTQVRGELLGFLGFTKDSRYLLATSLGNTIIFHDWLAGTTFEVPFAPGDIVPQWIVAVNG